MPAGRPTDYNHHFAYIDPIPKAVDDKAALQILEGYIQNLCIDHQNIHWRVKPTVSSYKDFASEKVCRRAITRFSIENDLGYSQEVNNHLSTFIGEAA